VEDLFITVPKGNNANPKKMAALLNVASDLVGVLAWFRVV
jgi:hypothetical protein